SHLREHRGLRDASLQDRAGARLGGAGLFFFPRLRALSQRSRRQHRQAVSVAGPSESEFQSQRGARSRGSTSGQSRARVEGSRASAANRSVQESNRDVEKGRTEADRKRFQESRPKARAQRAHEKEEGRSWLDER